MNSRDKCLTLADLDQIKAEVMETIDKSNVSCEQGAVMMDRFLMELDSFCASNTLLRQGNKRPMKLFRDCIYQSDDVQTEWRQTLAYIGSIVVMAHVLEREQEKEQASE